MPTAPVPCIPLFKCLIHRIVMVRELSMAVGKEVGGRGLERWLTGAGHSNSPWLLGGGEAEAPFTEVWKGKAAWLGSLRKSQLTQLCCAHPRADSVAWNPHKLLTAGLQCSALLLRDTTVSLPQSWPGPCSHLRPCLLFYPTLEGFWPCCVLLTIPSEAEYLWPP